MRFRRGITIIKRSGKRCDLLCTDSSSNQDTLLKAARACNCFGNRYNWLFYQFLQTKSVTFRGGKHVISGHAHRKTKNFCPVHLPPKASFWFLPIANFIHGIGII